MVHSRKIWKHIASGMLLLLYTAFLCFQVKSRLENGRIRVHFHTQQLAWTNQDGECQTVIGQCGHTDAIAKVKTLPSKRFHPTLLTADQPFSVSQIMVLYTPQKFAISECSFLSSSLQHFYPQRGPPTAHSFAG